MLHIALGVFFLDCVLFAVFHQWLMYGTLLYFIISVLLAAELKRSIAVYVSLLMLFLHDFIAYGRAGLSVVFAISIIFMIYNLKNVLRNAQVLLLALSLVLYFVLENIVIYGLLFNNMQSFLMTSMKIFINVIGGYIVLLGIPGNRPLKTSVIRGRKVWTPNRKDALQGL